MAKITRIIYLVCVCLGMFIIGQCIAASMLWPITVMALVLFIFSAILTLRTWAICGKNKLATYVIFGSYGILLVPVVIFFGLFLRTPTGRYTTNCQCATQLTIILFIVMASPVPQLFGCLASTNSLVYLALVYSIDAFYNGGNFLLFFYRNDLR